jgi:hypothetical protein
VAVIAAVAIVVGAPLVTSRRAPGDDPKRDPLAALEARKEVKYREIRDAELDYRTGKLAEADYRALDRTLRREAIALLREIDELTRLPEAGEDGRSSGGLG